MKSLVGKRRVGVLMGGLSAEREVSLKTGGAVMEALRRRGYRPLAIDVGNAAQREHTVKLATHGRG